MRLERRARPSRLLSIAAPIAALTITLVLAAGLISLTGAPVTETWSRLLEGGFGSRFAWSETLTRATPLMLTGLAAAVAFRARLWNIGAEGQFYAGALAAVAVASLAADPDTGPLLPTPVWFSLMLLAAVLAGASLMLAPAWLRVRLGVDEVVTTLLLNFIVLLFVSMMLDGPMKDPLAMGWPQSVALPDSLQLGRLMERTRLHSGLAIALGLAMMLWLWLRLTRPGFEVRAVGFNARAARFAGIPVTRTLLGVAFMSGALAGLAGAIEVAGRTTYLTLDISPGYGYAGIVIAMLAALDPLAVVVAAVFVAGIQVGADSMSRALSVPSFIADVIVACALLAMLVTTMFAQYRLRRR